MRRPARMTYGFASNLRDGPAQRPPYRLQQARTIEQTDAAKHPRRVRRLHLHLRHSSAPWPIPATVPDLLESRISSSPNAARCLGLMPNSEEINRRRRANPARKELEKPVGPPSKPCCESPAPFALVAADLVAHVEETPGVDDRQAQSVRLHRSRPQSMRRLSTTAWIQLRPNGRLTPSKVVMDRQRR